MRTRVFTLAIACVFLSLALPVYGQAPSTRSFGPQEVSEDKDPLAILELGAATSWNVTGGAATFAPNFAVETTPIENWLEIEAACRLLYAQIDGMGYGPAVQEALDPIA